MVRIDPETNTITVTKGDTIETVIDIKTKTGELYLPSAGDEIRFALKSTYSDPDTLIYKQIPNDTRILRIEADETELLTARRKPYVYDIQITFPDGTVDTFIDRAKLYVTEEVE